MDRKGDNSFNGYPRKAKLLKLDPETKARWREYVARDRARREDEERWARYEAGEDDEDRTED